MPVTENCFLMLILLFQNYAGDKEMLGKCEQVCPMLGPPIDSNATILFLTRQ